MNSALCLLAVSVLVVAGSVVSLAFPIESVFGQLPMPDPPKDSTVPGWVVTATLTTLLGAFGSLVGAIWFLLKQNSKQQRDHMTYQQKQYEAFAITLDKLAERHDDWEKLRHDDSNAMRTTLQDMVRSCTEARKIVERKT